MLLQKVVTVLRTFGYPMANRLSLIAANSIYLDGFFRCISRMRISYFSSYYHNNKIAGK